MILLKVLYLVDDHCSLPNLVNKVHAELHDQDKGKKREVYQKLYQKKDSDRRANLVLLAL